MTGDEIWTAKSSNPNRLFRIRGIGTRRLGIINGRRVQVMNADGTHYDFVDLRQVVEAVAEAPAPTPTAPTEPPTDEPGIRGGTPILRHVGGLVEELGSATHLTPDEIAGLTFLATEIAEVLERAGIEDGKVALRPLT